jgi:hypothetical protein
MTAEFVDEVASADVAEGGTPCEDYTTRQFRGILDCTRNDNNFFCDVLFNNTIEFEEDVIVWDRVYEDEDMAPLVDCCVQAPLIGNSQQFDRFAYSPAYSKFKSIFNACKPLSHGPGETPWSQMSKVQRRDAWMQRTMAQHDRILNRREEWMAFKVLQDAHIAIEGEQYPKVEMDFKRDPALKYVLKNKWGKGSCTAAEDLQDMYDLVACTGEGSPVINTLLMNSKTCRCLKNDDSFLECLKTERGPQLMQVNGFDITPRPQRINGARLAFTVGGVDIWCVDTYYTTKDKNGKKHKKFFLDDGVVIGLALGNEPCDAMPTKLYGAIMDCDVLTPMDRFTKSWQIPDPSAKVIMTQSAPLPVVLNPNATVCITGAC